MAKKKDKDNNPGFQDTSSAQTRRFDKDLVKNVTDYHLADNEWVHARNAINNTKKGDLGRLGNEPANRFCAAAPYTIIGYIHIEADKYAVFSTDNVNSEIGYFEEEICRYTTIVNDPCLNFDITHLINGQSRETSDCNHILYWDDGVNPSRAMSIGDIRKAPYSQPWPNVPYICEDIDPLECIDCEPLTPLVLDCNKIRLAPLMEPLCFRVEKAASGGGLANGSYFVVGAYSINGAKMTDYFPPSNIQPLFDHSGTGGSISIYVDNADTTFFDEFELIVISIVAQQTVARRVGFYSTRQKLITLDLIDNQLPVIPIETVPIRNQVYDKSDAMFVVNDYLLRVGPTTKFDFNYQPLANQIVSKWQSVEYDAEYYRNGGNKTGYMRDEVYAFFIRWVYDTGDRSPSFHIPGRPVFQTPHWIIPGSDSYYEDAIAPANEDNIELEQGICLPKVWEVYNTATFDNSTTQVVLPDENDECNPAVGIVLQEGYMSYWESTELYPDNKGEVWNSNITQPLPYSDTLAEDYNLCGKPIRHHKFPDNDISPEATIFDVTAAGADPVRSQKIRIMGVKFENIKRPLLDPADPSKGYVPGIKGFEILRGSRKGNRTIIAKGIINNMVEYDIPGIRPINPNDQSANDSTTVFVDETFTEKGLFQNYPYNDLDGDEFLSTRRTRWRGLTCNYGYFEENGYQFDGAGEGSKKYKKEQYLKNYFSFHSPETTFAKPFLGSRELKVYQELDGVSTHYYQYPAGHPEHKLMTDLAWILAAIAGLGAGAVASSGKIVRQYPNVPPGLIGNIAWETPSLNLLYGILGLGFQSRELIPLPGPIVPTAAAVESTGANSLSPYLTLLTTSIGGIPLFTYYFAEGAEATYRLLVNSTSFRQYALQQFSHCFYNNAISSSQGGAWGGLNFRPLGQRRRYIKDLSYVDDQIQDFTPEYRINNLYRSKYVALALKKELSAPLVKDISRKWTSIRGLADAQNSNSARADRYINPERAFERQSSTYYAAIKQRLRNQYGQIDSISQLPITTCPYIVDCPDGAVQGELVTNGTFDTDLNGWGSSPTGFWTWNAGTAQTSGAVGQNWLYTTSPISFIGGQQYQLCFDLVQLDPTNILNVGFINGANTGPFYFYQQGSYCIQFQANNAYDSVIFSELNQTPIPCLIDIVILFDVSESVCCNNIFFCPNDCDELNLQKDFAKAVINNLGPGIANGTLNIGFIKFSSGSTSPVVLDVLGNNSEAQLINTINGINTTGGDTNIAAAFCEAKNQFDTNGRVGAQKKILLITDGRHNTQGQTSASCYNINLGGCDGACGNTCTGMETLASNLRTIDNIEIIVAGTGTDGFPGSEIQCGIPYWNTYAGDPNNVYTAIFDDLQLIVDSISGALDCNKQPTIIDNVRLQSVNCQSEPFSIGPLFGGDIYINRYTEKNTFFYFYDWLFSQPDGASFDYQKYAMLPYPTYWANTESFDVLDGVQTFLNILSPGTIIGSLVSAFGAVGQYVVDLVAQAQGGPPATFNNSNNPIINALESLKTPSDYHVLDRPNFAFDFTGTFITGAINGPLAIPSLLLALQGCTTNLIIKYGYFYLFNSGVRDFYVESEYNLALRDWDDQEGRRHYDHKSYTSLPDMFKTSVIKSTNFYKYDDSLSIAKNWFSNVNWGNVQVRNYDPQLAETCYQYRPDRVIYSLQSQYESVRDNWRIFLANNYKDFLSRVTSIKQINKSGALILFEADSPVAFQGTDQLQTDLGTKLTIGDGGLFSQPMQSMMNAERSFEYGSCQNKLAVINTPVGTYWVSVNQGKIFQFDDSLSELSMGDLKWWLVQYLPYQLTKYYPEYTLKDNPVAGIGCQVTYDNENTLVYFTKKDYKPRLTIGADPETPVQYDANTNTFFVLQGQVRVPIQLGDPLYFEDASWTISYDPKIKGWVSFHDWHPDLTIPGKNTFMTTKGSGIWVHNDRCDLYTNYYGIDYPFEVEYMVNTVQEVNTLRSIEYQLEVYRYKTDSCYDRFHVLDFNFDEAVIYNTEQCSGLLKLNITPKNNPVLLLQYPQTTPTNIQILYSKEENKYRFNQFWDATSNRGEFPLGSDYPPTGAVTPGTTILAGSYPERTIWDTAPNGYIKTLNAINLDYDKNQLERKKFRHYTSSVFLRRKVSGNRKMLVSLVNNKNLLSSR